MSNLAPKKVILRMRLPVRSVVMITIPLPKKNKKNSTYTISLKIHNADYLTGKCKNT